MGCSCASVPPAASIAVVGRAVRASPWGLASWRPGPTRAIWLCRRHVADAPVWWSGPVPARAAPDGGTPSACGRGALVARVGRARTPGVDDDRQAQADRDRA